MCLLICMKRVNCARLEFVDLSRWMEMINNLVGVGTYDNADTDIGLMLGRSGAAGQW